jgi:signal transduction histidine kinase
MPDDMARTKHLDGRRAVASRFAWALAACLMLGLPMQPSAAQTRAVAEALSAEDTGLGRFPVEAAQRSVTLPDDWTRSPPRGTPLWYRLRFDAAGAAEPAGLLGLYIERACGNVEVQVNGQRLHAAGHMSDPISQDCQRPLLLPLPAALLQPRDNTLDLLLAGYPLQEVATSGRAAGLSAPLIGPYAQLHQHHAREVLLAVTLPLAASALLVLSGIAAFVMARARRIDSHLWYFGALAIGWALLTASPWWRDLPLPNEAREMLLASLPPLVALPAVQFLLHFAGWRSRPIEVALYAQCAAVPASLLLGGPSRVHTIASGWNTLLVLQVLAAMGFYLWSTRRARRRDFRTMAALLAVAAAALVFAMTVLQPSLATPWRHLPPLAIPLVLVAMWLHLLQQHGRSLGTAEEARLALETHIRQTAADMEKNYAHLAELRVEQVTQRERKRIAADLHDDLGAKLLTIVHTSESERISTLAREALEEMRLSVRGLTGKPVKLIDALGDWRAEVFGRLSQTGVEGEWNAPVEDLPQTLSARAYVQTTRILREAVSNIIKHSGASRCSIRCTIDSGDFRLAIQDNGKGIPLELDGRLDRGHGMASMKHRAKQLNGQCLVESGPGFGTVIRLTIPLERHTTPA